MLIGDRRIETAVTGIRPGEKQLPELRGDDGVVPGLASEYSSSSCVMSRQELAVLLTGRGLLVEETLPIPAEMLR